jgi:hypothetical protein
MKYSIRKNWGNSLGFIKKNPIVMMPFVVIAFLELLALEFIYFSSRAPLSHIVNPVIRKFFGEAFVHYPGSLVVLPRLFYGTQIVIYIVFGALLTAMAVNIFKNIKSDLPVKAKAIARNTLKAYVSFMVYAVLISVIVFVLKKIGVVVYTKTMWIAVHHTPQSASTLFNVGLTLSLFLLNLVMQTFLICTIPVMVIQKASLLKALVRSVILGALNFRAILTLIFIPFFMYLPMVFLKSFSAKIMDKTFPEMNLCITIAGIIITVFLDSFIIICVSQFVMDKKGAAGKTA